MSNEEFLTRAKNLRKLVSTDMNEKIDASRCNTHITKLESLKSELYDAGEDWIEDLTEIIDIDSSDEVRPALEEVDYQLGTIIGSL